MRWVVAAVFVAMAQGATADDLQRAQELAWARQFAESEFIYRRVLTTQPASGEAQLGLARVVMWQGRHAEAIVLFARLTGIEAMEGRATAEYWSGDYRAAARHFRRVLLLDPDRELARKSLAEIVSTATPSQSITIAGSSDDQPVDFVRTEVAATFFSDPLTRWTAAAGRYDAHAERGSNGTFASIANETKVKTLTMSARLGVFTFPDGAHRPIGSAAVRRGSLTLRLERQPELASASSLGRHVSSTTTSIRWERDRNWMASAEVSDRRYSDDNRGYAATGYVLIPARRNGWTLWSGVSLAVRDTEEPRFTLEGRYDPYWTPDDLREGRLVLSLERQIARASLKAHGDAGYARDRSRAGDFPFDRDYRPWRAGMTASLRLTRGFQIEAAIERSSTVDYRVTSFHGALVRRR